VGRTSDTAKPGIRFFGTASGPHCSDIPCFEYPLLRTLLASNPWLRTPGFEPLASNPWLRTPGSVGFDTASDVPGSERRRASPSCEPGELRECDEPSPRGRATHQRPRGAGGSTPARAVKGTLLSDQPRFQAVGRSLARRSPRSPPWPRAVSTTWPWHRAPRLSRKRPTPRPGHRPSVVSLRLLVQSTSGSPTSARSSTSGHRRVAPRRPVPAARVCTAWVCPGPCARFRAVLERPLSAQSIVAPRVDVARRAEDATILHVALTSRVDRRPGSPGRRARTSRPDIVPGRRGSHHRLDRPRHRAEVEGHDAWTGADAGTLGCQSPTH
jgi:hypothetical protein